MFFVPAVCKNSLLLDSEMSITDQIYGQVWAIQYGQSCITYTVYDKRYVIYRTGIFYTV